MEEKKVLERLQRQCARAEYCSLDVRRKALRALEGDAAAADRVVESLLKDRFVDDARYAGAFTREKSSLSGWGARKIAYALRSKGVSAEIISEAISESFASPRLPQTPLAAWAVSNRLVGSMVSPAFSS